MADGMLSPDEYDELVDLLHVGRDDDDRLTDWECEFLDTLRDRVAQYGVDVFVSDRQWEVIERLRVKLRL